MYVVLRKHNATVACYGSLVALSKNERVNIHSLNRCFSRKKLDEFENDELKIFKRTIIKSKRKTL